MPPIGDKKHVILSASEISHQTISLLSSRASAWRSPWVKCAAHTPPFIPTDCRSRYAPSQWHLFLRHIEHKRNGSTPRPPFVALTRATSPVSSGESTPGRVNFRKLCTFLFGRGIFRCAQYDVLFYTSFCQCRASKLACKGLRAMIFIRRKHFAKMQKTKVLMRQHCAPYIRSEESHRRTDWYMYFFTLVVGYFAIAQFNIKNQKNVAPL